jgi:hypothetical protein
MRAGRALSVLPLSRTPLLAFLVEEEGEGYKGGGRRNKCTTYSLSSWGKRLASYTGGGSECLSSESIIRSGSCIYVSFFFLIGKIHRPWRHTHTNTKFVIPPTVTRPRNAHLTTFRLLSPSPSIPPTHATLQRKNKRRMRLEGLVEGAGTGFNDRSLMVRDGTFSFGPLYDVDDDDDNCDDTSMMMDVEVRPIRRQDAVEAGLDYWMDEADLTKYRRRRIDVRDRRRRKYATSRTTTSTSSSTNATTEDASSDGMGGMSTDRLREEVVAPYKQNWIGWVSVFFVAMSTIVTKFPELLQIPIIPIPDL